MRAIRSHTTYIPIKDWFPSDDPVAAAVARLLILREDLYLELRGIVALPIPPLDECSEDWRMVYFFRNSVRTLLEIRGAIEFLSQQKAFFRQVKKLPKDIGAPIEALKEAMSKAHDVIKKA